METLLLFILAAIVLWVCLRPRPAPRHPNPCIDCELERIDREVEEGMQAASDRFIRDYRDRLGR